MKVRFGVIADLHTEYVHDGASRFKRFLDACISEKVDFCVQLGDFCPPGEKNADQTEEILSLLREIPFPFYHVIGNHDTDRNEKSDVLSYISASGAHTSSRGRRSASTPRKRVTNAATIMSTAAKA